MNLYFLVEGKRTEKKVYPAWLSHLVPSLRRVDSLDEIDVNTYFIFSGEGYPSLIGVHFQNAVQDYRQSGKLDRLVVCLDVDDSTPNLRSEEVFEVARSLEFPLEQLRVITQESCIESWFLGNRKAVASNPQSTELSAYVQFYDVRRDDPEAMGTFHDFNSRSCFHSRFFHLVAQEKRFQYTKHRPGHVLDSAFVDELIARRNATGHLPTFGTFIDLCDEILSEFTS